MRSSLTIILVLVMAIQVKPQSITVAGGNGTGGGASQFNYPLAICLDVMGNIYVADNMNHRVQKFPKGSTSVTDGFTLVSTHLTNLGAIALDDSGYIYVASNARIIKFPPWSDSTTVGDIIAGSGYVDHTDTTFACVGLSVSHLGHIYVLDQYNNRVMRFPLNGVAGTRGVIVAGGNGPGSAANQLYIPQGICIDESENVYVADGGNNRVQKFPFNSTSDTAGITIAGGNGRGGGANQFNVPASVYYDRFGYVYVADAQNNRIQRFPPNSNAATNGFTIVGGNGQGFAMNQFNGPVSVVVDRDLSVFVADGLNNRIQKWQDYKTRVREMLDSGKRVMEISKETKTRIGEVRKVKKEHKKEKASQ